MGGFAGNWVVGGSFGFIFGVVFGNWLVCGGVGLCRFVGVGLLVGWLGCVMGWVVGVFLGLGWGVGLGLVLGVGLPVIPSAVKATPFSNIEATFATLLVFLVSLTLSGWMVFLSGGSWCSFVSGGSRKEGTDSLWGAVGDLVRWFFILV